MCDGSFIFKYYWHDATDALDFMSDILDYSLMVKSQTIASWQKKASPEWRTHYTLMLYKSEQNFNGSFSRAAYPCANVLSGSSLAISYDMLLYQPCFSDYWCEKCVIAELWNEVWWLLDESCLSRGQFGFSLVSAFLWGKKNIVDKERKRDGQQARKRWLQVAAFMYMLGEFSWCVMLSLVALWWSATEQEGCYLKTSYAKKKTREKQENDECVFTKAVYWN